MAFNAEKLRSIRDAAADALEAAMLNPQPSYSVDGQSFQHDAYVERLQKSIDWADGKLRDMGEDDGGFGYETGVART